MKTKKKNDRKNNKFISIVPTVSLIGQKFN